MINKRKTDPKQHLTVLTEEDETDGRNGKQDIKYKR